MKRLAGLILPLALCLFADFALTEEPNVPPLSGEGPVQAQLEQTLDALELTPAVQDGRLAIALVRLKGKEFDGLGMVNGHRMYYAASLPKIAILYGAAVALDDKRIAADDTLLEDMHAMIRRSCNPCATRVLERIGREWLLDLLQNGPHHFYDPVTGGGLWVGKDYASAPAHKRDPLQGLSHAATVWQTARFYYLLIHGELASPEQTELMLATLADPGINHKFVAGLEGHEVDQIYRKSGTWKNFHADSALVVTGSDNYILVGLAHDPQGSQWLQQLAAALHGNLGSE